MLFRLWAWHILLGSVAVAHMLHLVFDIMHAQCKHACVSCLDCNKHNVMVHYYFEILWFYPTTCGNAVWAVVSKLQCHLTSSDH
jgi:hypothetical protein